MKFSYCNSRKTAFIVHLLKAANGVLIDVYRSISEMSRGEKKKKSGAESFVSRAYEENNIMDFPVAHYN